MKYKYIELLPFIVFCIMVSCTWYQLISNNYYPTIKHILALILALVNLGAYFWNYKRALIITGVLLVLASLSLVALRVILVSNSFYLKIGSLKIVLPPLNYFAFGLLIVYCILNAKTVKDAFKWVSKQL